MRKINIISALFAFILTAISLLGCDRRNLDMNYYEGTSVRINIDWSGTQYMAEHIRALFYPVDGGVPYSYYIDPAGENINVPYGEYNVVLYNWRSNDDVQAIRYSNEKQVNTFSAYTDLKTGTLVTQEALMQPDSLVLWSSGAETVALIKDHPCCDGEVVLNTRPVSQVCSYDFFIPATGMQYVRSAEAVISGISRSITLADGKKNTAGYPMWVTLTPTTGGINFHFSSFGLAPGADRILDIRFRLVDGTDFEFRYNMTGVIYPCGVRQIDTEIDIPEAEGPKGGFIDPGIEGWEDQYEEIIF